MIEFFFESRRDMRYLYFAFPIVETRITSGVRSKLGFQA